MGGAWGALWERHAAQKRLVQQEETIGERATELHKGHSRSYSILDSFDVFARLCGLSIFNLLLNIKFMCKYKINYLLFYSILILSFILLKNILTAKITPHYRHTMNYIVCTILGIKL